MDKQTLENSIKATGERLRTLGARVWMETRAAVVDGQPNAEGKLPDNPDKGAGSEPGVLQVLVIVGLQAGHFDESWFAPFFAAGATIEAVAMAVLEAISTGKSPLPPEAHGGFPKAPAAEVPPAAPEPTAPPEPTDPAPAADPAAPPVGADSSSGDFTEEVQS